MHITYHMHLGVFLLICFFFLPAWKYLPYCNHALLLVLSWKISTLFMLSFYLLYPSIHSLICSFPPSFTHSSVAYCVLYLPVHPQVYHQRHEAPAHTGPQSFTESERTDGHQRWESGHFQDGGAPSSTQEAIHIAVGDQL